MANNPVNLEALLRLACVPGVGAGKLRALIGQFRSADAVLCASKNRLIAVPGIDASTAQKIQNHKGEQFAREQLGRLKKSGGQLLSFWDKSYPKLLKHIYDPPAMLFIMGEFAETDQYSVAVVGSRQPSNYGKIATEKLAGELAARGITVVSGLAYGVDTIAHRSAINCGGRSLAVLGSGIDVVYPSENRQLASAMQKSGVVMSEYPMGTGPDRGNFPRRNRIICGLSHGVIVVEAGQKSGALITAAIALEQNREVFAVPGNIDSSKSIGTNALIKEGAAVVTSIEDVLDTLSVPLSPILTGVERTRPDIHLDDGQKRVMAVLSNEPTHVDQIANTTGESAATILSRLLNLELMNLVRQLPGKMFVRL